MGDTNEGSNARIKSTMLGIEDHGIFTFMLNLDYGGGSGQGAGGYALGTPKRTDPPPEYAAFLGSLICRILEVAGVQKWEDLPGTYIRVRANYTKVLAIGHLLEDKWLVFDEFITKAGA